MTTPAVGMSEELQKKMSTIKDMVHEIKNSTACAQTNRVGKMAGEIVLKVQAVQRGILDANALDMVYQLAFSLHEQARLLDELNPVLEQLAGQMVDRLTQGDGSGSTQSATHHPDTSPDSGNVDAFHASAAANYLKTAAKDALSSLNSNQLHSMIEAYRAELSHRAHSNGNSKSGASSEPGPSAPPAPKTPSKATPKGGSVTSVSSGLSLESLDNIIASAGLGDEELALRVAGAARRVEVVHGLSDFESSIVVRRLVKKVLPEGNLQSGSLAQRMSLGVLARELMRQLPKLVINADETSVQQINDNLSKKAQSVDLTGFINEAFGYDDYLAEGGTIPQADNLKNLIVDQLKRSNVKGGDCLNEVAWKLLNGAANPQINQFQEKLNEVKEELTAVVRGKFNDAQINEALKHSVRKFIRYSAVSNNPSIIPQLKNEFLAHVLLCLKKGTKLDESMASKAALCREIDHLKKLKVLSNEGKLLGTNLSSPIAEFISPPAKVMSNAELQGLRASLMPIVKASTFNFRNGERFRLDTLARQLSGPSQELVAKLTGVDSVEGDPGAALKKVTSNIDVKRVEVNGYINLMDCSFKDASRQRVLDRQTQELLESVQSNCMTKEQALYLNGLFKSQLVNSSINVDLYDTAVEKQKAYTNHALLLSEEPYAGRSFDEGLTGVFLKDALEYKYCVRMDQPQGKRMAGLQHTGGAVAEHRNRSFVMYMTERQALWNQVKPEKFCWSVVEQKGTPGTPIVFQDLDKIGFNAPDLTNERLIQMGKLVMSAVGFEATQKGLHTTIDYTYLNKMPALLPGEPAYELFVTEFSRRLGRTPGTLGSQLIDLMNRLNRDPLIKASAADHRFMGCLLTLMMRSTNARRGGEAEPRPEVQARLDHIAGGPTSGGPAAVKKGVSTPGAGTSKVDAEREEREEDLASGASPLIPEAFGASFAESFNKILEDGVLRKLDEILTESRAANEKLATEFRENLTRSEKTHAEDLSDAGSDAGDGR